ncbi:hypothetical protein P59_126 [Bacillus phage P59]|nr:hypothetical protein P59_126 [Bacillus phage P59]
MEFKMEYLGVPVKLYVVVFYNRMVNEIQTMEIAEVNEFRAGREFYRRKSRHVFTIEHIHTVGGY